MVNVTENARRKSSRELDCIINLAEHKRKQKQQTLEINWTIQILEEPATH